MLRRPCFVVILLCGSGPVDIRPCTVKTGMKGTRVSDKQHPVTLSEPSSRIQEVVLGRSRSESMMSLISIPLDIYIV